MQLYILEITLPTLGLVFTLGVIIGMLINKGKKDIF